MISLKKAKCYFKFTKCRLQQKMTYKFNFILTNIGQLIRCFIQTFLWRAIFLNSESEIINGFTSTDMILYVFMSAVIVNMTTSYPDSIMGYEVREGKIGLDIIKPINLQKKLYFDSLSDFISGTTFVALPLWCMIIFILFLLNKAVVISVKSLILFVISAFIGFNVMFLFNYCFGLISFFVTNMWGIRNLKHTIVGFLSGAIIPLSFFPKVIQGLFNILPFSSINYTPVMIYLGKITGYEILLVIGIQVVWIVILFFLSQGLWSMAIKRFTMLGG